MPVLFLSAVFLRLLLLIWKKERTKKEKEKKKRKEKEKRKENQAAYSKCIMDHVVFENFSSHWIRWQSVMDSRQAALLKWISCWQLERIKTEWDVHFSHMNKHDFLNRKKSSSSLPSSFHSWIHFFFFFSILKLYLYCFSPFLNSLFFNFFQF